MPTYVYREVTTGEEVELAMTIQEMEDLGMEISHPDRPGKKYKRVFTPAAVHFKGSGFYSTSSKA